MSWLLAAVSEGAQHPPPPSDTACKADLCVNKLIMK